MCEEKLSLLTSVGPKANLDWLALSAQSVDTVLGSTEWLVAAPPSISREVQKVVGGRATVCTMHTGNVAVARNSLLKKASGKYIMQFDADDLLCGIGVKVLLEKISKGGFFWGGSPLVDFDEHTSPIGQTPKKEHLSFEGNVIPKNRVAEIRSELLDVYPAGSVSVHPGASIFSRQAFIAVGGYDEEMGNRWEDYVPFFKMSKLYEGAWSPIPSLVYRRSQSSTTATPLSDAEVEHYIQRLDELEKSF